MTKVTVIERGAQKPTLIILLFIAVLALPILFSSAFGAESQHVTLPILANKTVAPRIVYIKNSRFPSLSQNELRAVVAHAARLVKNHFDITITQPQAIKVLNIDTVFADLVTKTPKDFDQLIGDFKNDDVDWPTITEMLIKQIHQQETSLDDQMAFVRPYLMPQLTPHDLASFAQAITDTFKARLKLWATATLQDGYPMIGSVPGRADLPLNEYGFWALMAKEGFPAEIILTNQLVASVEYIPIPVHTSIRGGITGGSTEYNPASTLGSSVWVSLAPFLLKNAELDKLRDNLPLNKAEALQAAGTMLAHELGHQLLHLNHPWKNPACLMRPAEVLKFSSWRKNLKAQKCPLSSEPAMTPGSIKIPIW
ncbi:MAG: hypothetical protein COB59_09315 [Rhodospirillaceae bacterium]|nr:MAG: hypothetical protein COB59_09315 [Rhodospirillaceae bacterium]